MEKDDSEIGNLASSQKWNKTCFVLRIEGQKSDSRGEGWTDIELMIPGTADRPQCENIAALKLLMKRCGRETYAPLAGV